MLTAIYLVFNTSVFKVGGRKTLAAKCGRVRNRRMISVLDMASCGDRLPLPTPSSTGDELFQMGMQYSTGQGGVPLDYVSAHMMFNLAAMRGSEAARRYRRELSCEMDRDAVAEAQRAAREWLTRAA